MIPSPDADSPLDDAAFALLMQTVGPFEARPALAVAVSGGSDSTALALLAARWARKRDGLVHALTVDHGLRPESAAEAAGVGQRLAAHGIPHAVLPWAGPRPRSGVQAAARAARYDLMTRWCHEAGVLHLLLAHTRDDQAETVLMRRRRARRGVGLAGMAAVAPGRDVRAVRPLLTVSRESLRATLRDAGETWIDDPSNADPRFERVRARAKLAGTARRCDARDRLLALARRAGADRRAQDEQVSALLGVCVTVDAAGFAWVDGAAWSEGDETIRQAGLARILTTIAGAAYGPSPDAALRAVRGMARGAGATLGGCRIVRKPGTWLVVREARGAGDVHRLADAPFLWDGRFMVSMAGVPLAPGLTVRRLGRDGWARIARHAKGKGRRDIPYEALAALPAVWNLDAPVAVAHLRFHQVDEALPASLAIAFRPRHPLGGTCFVPARDPFRPSLAAIPPHAKMFARDRLYHADFRRLSATETTF